METQPHQMTLTGHGKQMQGSNGIFKKLDFQLAKDILLMFFYLLELYAELYIYCLFISGLQQAWAL